MASVSIVKIKVRRGTDAERKQITLDAGELGFTTDTDSKRLFVGDGITIGGIPIGCKVYYNADLGDITTYDTAQPGDVIYDKITKQLLVLDNFGQNVGTASRFYIGPGVDQQTLAFSSLYPGSSGIIAVKDSGITEKQISSTTFTNGITGGSNTKIGINFDNVKITYSTGKLTVNDAGLNLALISGSTLPTSNPGPNLLWVDAGAGNVIKRGT